MTTPQRWVFTFLITVDGRSCTYSAFDESETYAELKIKTRYGVPADAVFSLVSKCEDRRKASRRQD